MSDEVQDIVQKDYITEDSSEFTTGMEQLHRNRFRQYLYSCGCYLMDLRLKAIEEDYHG